MNVVLGRLGAAAHPARVALFLAALLGSQAGCGTTPRRISPGIPSGLTARDVAQEFLDRRRDSFSTVHAGLELKWMSPVLMAETTCRASLVFRAPNLLRVRGTSAAFFTIFEVVADPDTIRFDVPREDLLVIGARSDSAWAHFPLDPDLVAIALSAHPDPRREGERPLVDSIPGGGDSLQAVSAEGVMTFDPATGMPASFSWDGDRDCRIRWQDWTRIDGVDWPLRVELTWPGTGEELTAEFGRVQFDRKARESSFSESPSDDREILGPEEGLRRWREALRSSVEGSEPRKS